LKWTVSDENWNSVANCEAGNTTDKIVHGMLI
jgi:hypothetical protein